MRKQVFIDLGDFHETNISAISWHLPAKFYCVYAQKLLFSSFHSKFWRRH